MHFLECCDVFSRSYGFFSNCRSHAFGNLELPSPHENVHFFSKIVHKACAGKMQRASVLNKTGEERLEVLKKLLKFKAFL